MHLQEKVYVDLNGEGTGCPLGVIEPVAFGELTDWFHCIVVMRKHDRSPCRMVDLSHSLSKGDPQCSVTLSYCLPDTTPQLENCHRILKWLPQPSPL